MTRDDTERENMLGWKVADTALGDTRLHADLSMVEKSFGKTTEQ